MQCGRPSYQVSAKKRSQYPDLWAGQTGYEHTTDVLKPNISCYHATRGGFCENKCCETHGHMVRERAAVRRVRYRYQDCDTYSCTLNYSCWLGYNQFRVVLSEFIQRIQKVRKGLGNLVYWYEVEWVDVVPHVNFVFRLPEGSDKRHVGERVRECWKYALEAGGVPWLSQRTGVELVDKTWEDTRQLTRYDHKTNPGAIPLNNCRPVGWAKVSYTHPQWCQDTGATVESCIEDAIRDCGLLDDPVQPLEELCYPPFPEPLFSPGPLTPFKTTHCGLSASLITATLPRGPPVNCPQW